MMSSRTAGVMSNDDGLRTAVVDAAGRAGEAMWPMPLPPELRKGLDSEIADMVNTGPREGGMLTAGLFLQEFVGEGVTWAHLDIAGPAFASGGPSGHVTSGGTGFAVATLVDLADALVNGSPASGSSGPGSSAASTTSRRRPAWGSPLGRVKYELLTFGKFIGPGFLISVAYSKQGNPPRQPPPLPYSRWRPRP